MAKLSIPGSTYRLQLDAELRFVNARTLVPYLHDLGITDLYSSPILQARHGSRHGYDVTDPTRLNSEIGNEEEFEGLASELHRCGMGLLLDVVPNHMAASIENPWWVDVLENGPASNYAAYFDIDWHPPAKTLENKVLLPLLGRRFAEVLDNRELLLLFEERGFIIQYGSTQLPIAPKSYLRIVGYHLDELKQGIGADAPAFREVTGILAALEELPERVALPSAAAGDRRLRGEDIKNRLWQLYNNSPEIRSFIDENLRVFNGKKGNAGSFIHLDELLSEQAYVLAFWQTANEEINYRRFFTINDLVGMRVEDPLVFDATHRAILRFVERGAVTGLRIDHIDGLRDPAAYLRRLEERLAPEDATIRRPAFYVIVEKILGRDEVLPEAWPSFGTTGYDFLNALSRLFVDARGHQALVRAYGRFLGGRISYHHLVYEKKKQVMETFLAVEMRALGHHLSMLAGQDRYARDLPAADLAQALIEVTAFLPIYRTYIRSLEVTASERRRIKRAVEVSRRHNPHLKPGCFDFLLDVLALKNKTHLSSLQKESRLNFVMRWQQFSGPVMAKGLEDTALYIYNPLTSLNEVGGDPSFTDHSVADFHDFCRLRRKNWPNALNATTTHDTKRAEDVRARINVLSEIPSEWQRHLELWTNWNNANKQTVDGQVAPDRNEE
ncbi:MAG: malto-oligosyltrehalose synthase, partial [Terriglobia bacterium]